MDERRCCLTAPVHDSRRPFVMSEVTPEYLAAHAPNDERLRLLQRLDPRSTISVPLFAHSRFLGVLVLASDRPGRYSERDLSFVGELAYRAALAIDNGRLYHAAQRASRARDEVLGVVAHDLRNPLTSIFLAARVLEQWCEKEERSRGRTLVQKIVRASERSNRLVDDLLQVTRIEAGKLSVEAHAVSPQLLVSEVLEEQQLLAAAAGVSLRTKLENGLPELHADHDRLLQVFENLLGNAIKFTQPGAVVTIGAAARDGAVRFWVANPGEVIRADDMPHLFDRFWQARRSERRGAGLGLPIAKGIVEAHGGRIWAESDARDGTTFSFTIPIHAAATESAQDSHPQPTL